MDHYTKYSTGIALEVVQYRQKLFIIVENSTTSVHVRFHDALLDLFYYNMEIRVRYSTLFETWYSTTTVQ